MGFSRFSTMLIRRRRASNRPTASATNSTTAMATEIQITLGTRPSWQLAAQLRSAGQPRPVHMGQTDRSHALRESLARGRTAVAAAAQNGGVSSLRSGVGGGLGSGSGSGASQISDSSQLVSDGTSSGISGWSQATGSGNGSRIGGGGR